MFEKEKAQILKYGIYLDRYGLITLSGGNLSMRLSDGNFLVTPSGMIYEEMDLNDLVIVDKDGNVVEGHRRPSVDTAGLLYIFNHRPDLNAVIHTHQPYATAIGLIQDEFPCNLTTLANAAHGSVKVCPYASTATEDLGVQAVKYLNDQLAVILKHHGLIGVGKDLKQALYACVYTEEAAKTYYVARAMSPNVAELTQAQIDQAVDVFNHYGQK
jgi:L-ribulose-5-phosphate 4-epimerase